MIKNEQEYLQKRKTHKKLENELKKLEEELISYERTRPENIKETRKLLQYGCDIDENTGMIYDLFDKCGMYGKFSPI